MTDLLFFPKEGQVDRSFSYGQEVTGQEQNWVEVSPVVRRGQARGSLVGGVVDPHHSGCSVG